MHIEVIHMFEGVSNSTLTAYIQETVIDNNLMGNRPAVIICPGGGYIGITEKEAEPVALRFISAGYNAFVLRYSIGAEMARFPAPFIDAAKAVMLVRENAGKWSIDPDNISLCGFSTGGHIAAILAATWQEEYLAKALNANSKIFRPNKLILGYPLLNMLQFKKKNIATHPERQPVLDMIFTAAYGTMSPSNQLVEEWNCKNRITLQMPPTFIWTTSEDDIVGVEECLDFIKVLAANNISYEFHIFEKGDHGLSLGDQTVGYSVSEIKKHINAHEWVDLALNWINAH